VNRLAIAALLLAAGCNTSEPVVIPPGTGPVAATPSSSATVPAATADFTMWISNQGSRHPTIDIEVRIDDSVVVDGSFPAGQHTFFPYALRLGPGTHRLVARTPGGTRIEQTFEVSAEKPRYATLFFWSYEGDPVRFTFELFDEPPGFG